jgi:hypothetical protein
MFLLVDLDRATVLHDKGLFNCSGEQIAESYEHYGNINATLVSQFCSYVCASTKLANFLPVMTRVH